MRKWFVVAGLVALGTIVVATQDFGALADPWAIEVTIEKRYHENGNISVEAPYNRWRQIHGWQLLYDEEGRITAEVFHDHGDWLVSRCFDYDKGQLFIREANGVDQNLSVEPIPRATMNIGASSLVLCGL